MDASGVKCHDRSAFDCTLTRFSFFSSAMPSDNTRARNWCFTLNNPEWTGPEYKEFLETREHVKWFVFQKEKAPTTGTLHFQGFVGFTNAKTMSAVKVVLNSLQVHLEPMKARDASYAMKEETRVEGPWTYGDFPAQGKRTDFESLWNDIKNGATELECFEKHASLTFKCLKSVQRARSLVAKHRNPEEPPRVVLWTGPPGVGKTKSVMTWAAKKNYEVYSKTLDGSWFDGYRQQKVVLIDEVDKQDIKFSLLLQILDRYPLTVPVKGGSEIFNSPFIFLTATNGPEAWGYSGMSQAREQIERRIDSWFKWNDKTKKWVSMPLYRPIKQERYDTQEYHDIQNEVIVISDDEDEVMPDQQTLDETWERRELRSAEGLVLIE